MYMHKLRFVILWLVLLLIFSCQTQQNAQNNEEKPTVGFLAYSLKDTFIQMIEKVVKKASVDRANVVSEDAQNDRSLQDQQVSNLSHEDTKSVIVNIVDRNQGPSVLKILKQKNIPVVFINREPEESVITGWNMAYYVGAKPLEAGRMSVEIILDFFMKHRDADRNGDGLVQYVVLMGDPAHQDTVYRTQAYKETFDESDYHQGIGGRELARVAANWDRETAKEKMNEVINTFGIQIEAVLANNDEMALGAIDALKEAGYFRNRYIPVVGVDGIEEALISISEGELLGTVLNDSVSQGVDALYIAAALANKAKPIDTSVKLTAANGRGSGRYIWVPYYKVTKENYRGYLIQKNPRETQQENANSALENKAS